MSLAFSDLYTAAARWAQDTSTTGLARAKDAVVEANKQLSYGLRMPPLRPWWRKREDTITPVAGTQTYALPSTNGTFESLHQVWYRSGGLRIEIPLVEDTLWTEQANENTAQTGTPSICNHYSNNGTDSLRFSPTPSSGFISSITGSLIRLDGFIYETLVATSGDTVQPLMPDSRRWGIVWKAVEYLGALQGDKYLVEYGAAQGKLYYDQILADDLTRSGTATRHSRPTDPIGRPNSAQLGVWTDYGHTR